MRGKSINRTEVVVPALFRVVAAVASSSSSAATVAAVVQLAKQNKTTFLVSTN